MNIVEKKGRLLSLDVFRGITIFAMILVNNPGSWSNVYSPLLHAKWNGCTPTDLIFPFFLYIVGISTVFSLNRFKLNGEVNSALYLKIFKRSFTLFLLGYLLSLIPYFYFSSARIPGVLQRIGIVYFFGALLFLKLSKRNIYIVIGIILTLYFLLINYFSFDHFNIIAASKENNIAAWLDRFLLNGHLYRNGVHGDPEGVLSTLPALCTVLIGVLFGDKLKNSKGIQTVADFYLYGFLLCVAGLIVDLFFPINKHLWTSSYVLYTGGLATLFLATCYYVMDLKEIKKWFLPFHVFGTNAITVFFLSSLTAKLMYVIKLDVDGKSTALKSIIYNSLFSNLFSPKFSSLLFALTYLSLWYLVIYFMYRKKIFLKI